MRRLSLLLSCSVLCALSLGACRSIVDPTFMPAGYSYHRAEYKSPPGPPAADIGYGYTSDKNEQILNEWRHALRDLIMQAQGRGMAIPQTVALTTDLDTSAFQGTYDSLLREGLRAYGYELIDPAQADPATPRLFYSAYGAKTPEQLKQGGPAALNDEPGAPEDARFAPDRQSMDLVIGLVKDGQVLDKVSGRYDIQVFGFEEGTAAYRPGHERPVKTPPVEGAAPRPLLDKTGLNP